MPNPVVTAKPIGVRNTAPASTEEGDRSTVSGVPHPPHVAKVSAFSFPQYAQRFMFWGLTMKSTEARHIRAPEFQTAVPAAHSVTRPVSILERPPWRSRVNAR